MTQSIKNRPVHLSQSRIVRYVQKVVQRAAAHVIIYQIRHTRNRDAALVDRSNSIVVSVASHGDRLQSVHLTIETIGRGELRPGRIILWVDADTSIESLPPSIHRQIRRGLEVKVSSVAYGPHTKYYPYVLSEDVHRTPLVTADDDCLYPRTWLLGLQRKVRDFPDQIHCYRAHRVRFANGDKLAPYNDWPPVRTTAASLLHFATGVSGVYYPPNFLNRLRDEGDGFLETCPNADDIWLHYIAVLSDTPVRQYALRPRKFPEIPNTQVSALHKHNTGNNANDSQLAHTHDSVTIAKLSSLNQQT